MAASPEGELIGLIQVVEGQHRFQLLYDQQGVMYSEQPTTYRSLSWSPNGKWIAATTEGTDSQDLVLLAHDGSLQRVLFHDEQQFVTGTAQWSPDGRFLAVMISPQLPSLPIESNTWKRSLLILDVVSGNNDVFVIDLDPRLSPTVTTWAGNQDKIVLSGGGDAEACGTWIFDLRRRTLVAVDGWACSPTPTFDGRAIVFAGTDRQPDPKQPTEPWFGIYRMGVNGGPIERLWLAEEFAPSQEGEPWARATPLWWLNETDLLVETVRAIGPAAPGGLHRFRFGTTLYRANVVTKEIQEVARYQEQIAVWTTSPAGSIVYRTSFGNGSDQFWRLKIGPDSDFRRVSETASCLHVRQSPSAQSVAHTCLVDGERVLDLHRQENAGSTTWQQVKTRHGQVGWVDLRYLAR